MTTGNVLRYNWYRMIRAWLVGLLREEAMALRDLAEVTGIRYCTLRHAALDGRLTARKMGNQWVATESAVDRAVRAGKMRGRE